MWETNDKFRNSALDELIKDCTHMEVAGIVSGTMAVISPLERKVNSNLRDFCATVAGVSGEEQGGRGRFLVAGGPRGY